MNIFEDQGLRWLQDAISQNKILVTCADKGNAILILTPDQIYDIQLNKLSDTQSYTCLGDVDPTPRLSARLHELWCEGVLDGHITELQARKTVGIQKRGKTFTQSTSDIFKPGGTYGYPLLKVHKLSIEQLRSKTIPPSRFVSDLSKSLTVRSDKFITFSWLHDLAKDFATDLVRDSTEALLRFETLSSNGTITDDMYAFGFDVISLYDSLSPALAIEAFISAATQLRPGWTPEFITWLSSLINLSFEASFLSFRGKFYKGNLGIPTGGSLSVDLANIAVKFALDSIFSSTSFFSTHVRLFSRFVDDGVGIISTDVSSFECWMKEVNCMAKHKFNLGFTYEIKPVTEWSIFLDIRFKYSNGNLFTDINRKLTDAGRYLQFTSYHPRHTFSSIVFSQGLRFRRIINDDDLLDTRLNELREFFVFSSYDPKMVDQILSKVRATPRSLEYGVRDSATDEGLIYWPCTYGPGYEESKHKAMESNRILSESHDPNISKFRFKVVPRRAPNLKDLLFKRKAFSLNNSSSTSSRNNPCGRPRCKTCPIIGDLYSKGTQIKSVGGTCTTKNCIYLAQCQSCVNLNLTNNLYVGKTITCLSIRINNHRAAFSQMPHLTEESEVNDRNCLWAHLSNVHALRNRVDFDKNYKFCILQTGDPRDLRLYEQSFIKKLNTLFPHGLNTVNSVSY